MIRQYLANRKIKKFLITMTRILAHDYGKFDEYTEGQVTTALKKLGYGDDLKDVAIGIFCDEEIAKGFGLDDALIKKYRGYPSEHRVNWDVGSSAGFSDFGDSN